MIPHPVKVTILEVTHLTWHLVTRLLGIAIFVYYYLLSNIEQASRTRDYLSDAYFPIKDLRKPKHIAFSFTNEMDQLDLDSVARILCWCKQLGVSYITLYDDLGRLKDKHDELLRHIESKIRLFGCEKPVSRVEGLSILSRSDGRPKFLNDVKEMVRIEPGKINLDLVNERVCWPSDPELLVSFGSPLCVYGFPPWQLRLTEIFSIPTHRNLPLKSFIDVMKCYSRTSQREGV